MGRRAGVEPALHLLDPAPVQHGDSTRRDAFVEHRTLESDAELDEVALRGLMRRRQRRDAVSRGDADLQRPRQAIAIVR